MELNTLHTHAHKHTHAHTLHHQFCSHEELMEQLESTNRDLHLTSERLRKVEAQRLSAVREVEGMRLQVLQMELDRKAMQAAAKQRWVGGGVGEVKWCSTTGGMNSALQAIRQLLKICKGSWAEAWVCPERA